MAVMGYSLCIQQLGLCSLVCPKISTLSAEDLPVEISVVISITRN